MTNKKLFKSIVKINKKLNIQNHANEICIKNKLK